MSVIKDPSLYRELSVPFAGRREAADAADAFFEAVRGARKEHRIADAAIVIQVSYVENGDEHHVLFRSHHGSSSNQLQMLAQAFGAAKQEHTKLLELLAAFESD